jgi:tetratricopeptide (TPR) repeat protein
MGVSVQRILILLAAILGFFYFLLRVWRNRRQAGGAADSLAALNAVLESYRRGDFEIGLGLVEGLKDGSSKTPQYCFFRGKMLYQLGRLAEAEACLTEGRGLENDQRRVALCSEALGYAVLEQLRYADAIVHFENCIRIWPDRGCGHRAVAETMLRQGNAKDALVRARKAEEIDRAAQALTPEIHNLNLAEALATLAWAVAAGSGDRAEVDKLVAEALTLCTEDRKPVLAQLRYHAGRAYAALGMAEKSAEHFRHAVALDPQGNFGRLARAAAPSTAA